jgi:hypothetical protein
MIEGFFIFGFRVSKAESKGGPFFNFLRQSGVQIAGYRNKWCQGVREPESDIVE